MNLLAVLIVLTDKSSFTIDAPNAKAVQFASDLTDWKPVPMSSKGGKWTISYDLPKNARVEYQFVIDDKWSLDPKNAKWIDNGIGGRNSVWMGAAYRLTQVRPSPIKWKKSNFAVKYGKDASSEVVVYTPEIVGLKSLPCLVLFDGPDYVNRAKALDIAGKLIRGKEIVPIQFVFFRTVRDRTAELWQRSGDYEAMVVGAVKGPLRGIITADPKKRFTGGASLGGYFGLLLLRKYSDTFAGGLLSQSGAFGVSKDAHLPQALTSVPQSARIFLDFGEYEKSIVDANIELAPRLKPRRVTVLHTYEGHNWTAWRERMPHGLKALFGTSYKQ